MNGEPESPFLALGLGVMCAAAAWMCHIAVRFLRDGRVLGPSSFQTYERRLDGHWLFKSRENWLFFQRSIWVALLLGFKWVLIAAAGMMAVYPLIYFTTLARN